MANKRRIVTLAVSPAEYDEIKQRAEPYNGNVSKTLRDMFDMRPPALRGSKKYTGSRDALMAEYRRRQEELADWLANQLTKLP